MKITSPTENYNLMVSAAKQMRILDLIRLLHKGKYTLEEIKEKMDMSHRTAYRYLALLEFMDMGLEKDFDRRYFLVEGKCQLCGR